MDLRWYIPQVTVFVLNKQSQTNKIFNGLFNQTINPREFGKKKSTFFRNDSKLHRNNNPKHGFSKR